MIVVVGIPVIVKVAPLVTGWVFEANDAIVTGLEMPLIVPVKEVDIGLVMPVIVPTVADIGFVIPLIVPVREVDIGLVIPEIVPVTEVVIGFVMPEIVPVKDVEIGLAIPLIVPVTVVVGIDAIVTDGIDDTPTVWVDQETGHGFVPGTTVVVPLLLVPQFVHDTVRVEVMPSSVPLMVRDEFVTRTLLPGPDPPQFVQVTVTVVVMPDTVTAGMEVIFTPLLEFVV